MNEDADFETPILLLAMPQVLDPFFYRSVVLLLQHEDEGSQGFIVNRPTGVKVSEILEDLEIPWAGDDGILAFFGGPVQPQLGTLLYNEAGPVAEETRHKVCPGVGMTQNVTDLESLASEPPRAFRLLLGYAGWGEGQLVKELLRNDWMTAPVRTELVFSDRPEDVWERAMASVGVDPSLLPAWTPDAGESSAN